MSNVLHSGFKMEKKNGKSNVSKLLKIYFIKGNPLGIFHTARGAYIVNFFSHPFSQTYMNAYI